MSATLTFNEQTVVGGNTYVRPLHLRNGLRQLTGYLTESSYPTTGIDLNILNSYFNDLRSTIFQPKNGVNQYKAEFDGARYLHLYQQIPVMVVEEAHTIVGSTAETVTLDYPASYLLAVSKASGVIKPINSSQTLAENECQLVSTGNSAGSVTINATAADVVYFTYLTSAFGTRRTEEGAMSSLTATFDYPAVFVESAYAKKTTNYTELHPVVGMTSAASGYGKCTLNNSGVLTILTHTDDSADATPTYATYISEADAAKWGLYALPTALTRFDDTTESAAILDGAALGMCVPSIIMQADAGVILNREYSTIDGTSFVHKPGMCKIKTTDTTADNIITPLLMGNLNGVQGWAEVTAGTAITDQIDMYILGTTPRKFS